MSKSEQDPTPFQVAKTYWSLPFKERSFEKVCELLGMQSTVKKQQTKNQNRLSQLARVHEQKGLVKHRVLPDRIPGFADHAADYAPLLPDLEDVLRRRFGLRDVLVLDTSDSRFESGVTWQYKDDDLLHEHLGRWASRILASVVRPDDIVATGGGRGPHYTAHYCTIPPRGTYPKQVVSLTGSISAGMWRGASEITDDNVTRDVDADHIASVLHSKLGTKLTPEYLNCKITDKHELAKTNNVTVAVVGIGALGGGHRLKRFEILDDLEKVKDLVKKLNDEVTNAEKSLQDTDPFFHCVGDVCNYYFVLEEVKNLTDGDKIYQRLSENVSEINKRFVNTHPEDLTRICNHGAVIAVAGGPHKTRAILHALRQNEKGSQWVTHLVTSDEVARQLLKLLAENDKVS